MFLLILVHVLLHANPIFSQLLSRRGRGSARGPTPPEPTERPCRGGRAGRPNAARSEIAPYLSEADARGVRMRRARRARPTFPRRTRGASECGALGLSCVALAKQEGRKTDDGFRNSEEVNVEIRETGTASSPFCHPAEPSAEVTESELFRFFVHSVVQAFRLSETGLSPGTVRGRWFRP